MKTCKKQVYGFAFQPTPSFEMPPQREEYEDDESYFIASRRYQHEWRQTYYCVECNRGDCPQHFPSYEGYPALTGQGKEMNL